MIDLSCGVIRISNKCSWLEIFDQQDIPNLTPIGLIPYHLVSELRAQDRIYVFFAFLLNLIFIYFYLFSF